MGSSTRENEVAEKNGDYKAVFRVYVLGFKI